MSSVAGSFVGTVVAMEISEFWHLSTEVTVVQAALLIINEDPEKWLYRLAAGLAVEERPRGYEATMSALKTDVYAQRLPAQIIMEDDDYGRDAPVDWSKTTIAVSDLRDWLKARGLTADFFAAAARKPGYLDSDHPKYAPKLAAAVRAWTAVAEDEALHKGKSVKKALENWLEENAAVYGLLLTGGEINRQGIEETAKIANWDFKGGAPKTPTRWGAPFEVVHPEV